MSNELSLGSYVRKGFSDPDLFGVELEIESKSSPRIINEKHINTKADNSLRNGAEYVFDKPLNMKDTEAAIKFMCDTLKKSKSLQISPRCSTHIHVNVLDLTCTELLNFIAGAWYYENLIVDSCAPYRQNNNFCTRIADSEQSVFTLVTKLKEGKTPFSFKLSRDRFKYSATNLCTINQFGSLEFRMFQATIDPKEILAWVHTLNDIKHWSKSFKSCSDMLRELEKNKFSEISEKVLSSPEHFTPTKEYDRELNNLFLISKLLTTYDPDVNALTQKKTGRKKKAVWNGLIDI